MPMTAPPQLPVLVLTGFLGSGKTTLLNSLLRQPEFSRTAVIVNELGAVGIDQLLVAAVADGIVLLESGCLCCTLLNSFKETLLDLQARSARGEVPAFARVVVETTGLADPANVIRTLLRDSLVNHYFSFAGLIVTVDAVNAVTTLEQFREARAQLALADLIVVTKTDLTDESVAPVLQQRLQHYSGGARWLPASHGKLTAAQLTNVLSLPVRDLMPALPPAADHHADVRVASFVVPDPVGWAGLAAFSSAVSEFLGPALLRCKGFVEITELQRPVLVQAVQGVFAAATPLPDWPDADRRSRLVCITREVEPRTLQACIGLLSAAAGTFRPASVEELLQ